MQTDPAALVARNQPRHARPGESYGGVYVPLLAQRILRHNGELAQRPEGQREHQQQQEREEQEEQRQQQEGEGRQQQEQQQRREQQRERQAPAAEGQGTPAAPLAASRRLRSSGRGGARRDLAGDRRRRVRLVGYMVGNGVTDDQVDGDALVRPVAPRVT